MKFALAALAVLTCVRLILAAVVPLAPDEAYYYLWSHHLQSAYFDHPPMVAVWIRAGTALLGPTKLGIRLLGPLAAAVGTVLLYDAGESLFPGRRVGFTAALLLNATLLVGVGAIIMAPDTPLMFFWAAALAGLGRLVRTGDERWWVGVGVAVGLALVSKYTAGLLLLGVGGWLVFGVEGRARLRRPWPWVGLALAGIIFAPVVFWNFSHHWASFIKQGDREAGFDAPRTVQFLVELGLSLVFLGTPVIFVMAVRGLRALGRSEPERLLLWLTLLPLAVFVEHALSDRIQGNWIAILFPTACLAAAVWSGVGRWLAAGLWSGLALTVLVYVQVLTGVVPIPAPDDPSALQLAGWPALAQAGAAGVPGFVTSDDYATAAMLALYAPAGVPVLGFDSHHNARWVFFGFPVVRSGTGVLLTRRADAWCPVLLGRVPRMRGAEVIATYRLCRVSIGKYPGYVLPRP